MPAKDAEMAENIAEKILAERACVVMRRDDWDHKSKPKMDGSEMGLSTNGVYQKWLFYKFHKGKSNENMDDDLQMEGFQDV